MSALARSVVEASPDRRRGARVRIAGEAMAVFTTGDEPARLTYVDLMDASVDGVGVLSPIAVSPGSYFSLTPEAGFFPRHTGVVVRCEESTAGYRLGLSCTGTHAPQRGA